MTTHARVVLADRRDAHADLVDGLQGSDWRRRWTTVVVLLRTVLHILHKVDAERDPEVRSAVQAVWLDLKASKPEPATLWCFIEETETQSSRSTSIALVRAWESSSEQGERRPAMT
jgi:hypothetical protein